jgi:LAGLIDADG-like domain
MKRISFIREISKDLLAKTYEEHGTIKKTAQILDVDKDTVSKFLVLYEIVEPKLPKKILDIGKEKFIEDYKILGINGVMTKYNIHPITINKGLKFLGIDKIRESCYFVNENFFDDETPEAFYIAGFIAADGCLYDQKKSNKPNILNITLALKDKNHLEKIKNLLQFAGPLHLGGQEKRNDNGTLTICENISLQICSTKICNSLKRFGLGERKSLTYKMSKWLLTHPLVNYFLLGYFDGDGHIGFNNKRKNARVEIVGTKKFLQQLNKLLTKNNIIDEYKRKISYKNGIYRIGYSGNPNIIKIYSYLLGNKIIYMQRKYNMYNFINNFYMNNPKARGFKYSKLNLNIDEVKIKYKEIKNLKQIAAIYNCSISSIQRIIKKL